ncbi:tat pathway signal sequence protein [Rutstroemia sp. NJR-2017a BBW]|nr:tat pathway signal sequence protein [Rutstroemia sp. NJR-2017a BBW]
MLGSVKQYDVSLLSDFDDTITVNHKVASSWEKLRQNLKRSIRATLLPWLICTSLFIWILVPSRSPMREREVFLQLTYSPVQHLLEYEVRKFRLGLGDDITEYQGEPSPELDERWNSLYSMGITKVPLEVAKKLPNQTIIFPHDEKREYLIEIDNMIRKALRPDYYHNTMPGDDELFGVHHIDHCVDAIRQSLMCTVDVSVLTWGWDEGRRMHLEKGTVLHTCRNFDKVRDWAREHMVTEGFDSGFREMNYPLDRDTWLAGYNGE